MATGAPIPMTTDAHLLTLAQWFSPAYPLGAFSYSHGLEGAVALRQVQSASEVQAWIEAVLQDGTGRADTLFLATSYRASGPEALAEIDAMCRAFAPSLERLQETERQGAAFCKITAEVWGTDMGSLTYPVAVGWAAQVCELPQVTTAAFYLHAFASNLVSAAQRLTGLGQTEAQRMIKALAPLCEKIAGETASGDLTTLSSTAFMTDIAAMKHETQYSRIFQT